MIFECLKGLLWHLWVGTAILQLVFYSEITELFAAVVWRSSYPRQDSVTDFRQTKWSSKDRTLLRQENEDFADTKFPFKTSHPITKYFGRSLQTRSKDRNRIPKHLLQRAKQIAEGRQLQYNDGNPPRWND